MNIIKRHTLFILSTTILLPLITACTSSDKPSASEAQQAFETQLGIVDCKNIEISDFDRTNGIPQQDGSYVIQANYSAKIKPTDEVVDFVENAYSKSLSDAASNPSEINLANDSGRSRIIAGMRHACPNASIKLLTQALVQFPSYTNFDKPVEISVTNAQIDMIKTDNGWQARQ